MNAEDVFTDLTSWLTANIHTHDCERMWSSSAKSSCSCSTKYILWRVTFTARESKLQSPDTFLNKLWNMIAFIFHFGPTSIQIPPGQEIQSVSVYNNTEAFTSLMPHQSPGREKSSQSSWWLVTRSMQLTASFCPVTSVLTVTSLSAVSENAAHMTWL